MRGEIIQIGGRSFRERDGQLFPATDIDTPTMYAPEQSVMDRARAWSQDRLMSMGLDAHQARGISEKILGRAFARPQADPATRMVEGAGLLGLTGGTAPLTAMQAGEDARDGKYAQSAIGGIFAGLEAAPAVGSALRFGRGVAPVGAAASEMARISDAYTPRQPLIEAGRGGYQAQPGKPSAVAIPGSGRFEARPVGPIEEAARDYMRSRGVEDFGRVEAYPEFDEARAAMIAQAYDQMRHDPQNPLVRRAYDAMIEETLGQYRALTDKGIEFKFLRDGMSDPYARSPALGYQDLVENGRLWVFPTDFGFGSSSAFDPAENPLLARVGRIGDKPDAVANDAFRVVHDTFGHFGPGNPFFRHQGEERAWVEHSRMFSPEARGAMTSETRGQNSWLNFGPHGQANRTALGADTVFADQKSGLLPEWIWYEGGLR